MQEQKTDPDVIETAGSISITGKEPEPEKTKRRRSKKSARWHFPNANECPRCKAHDTVATSTKGKKQYRSCRRGHCRYRYCVIGIREK